MRIISGKARGTVLENLSTPATRPTAQRVKEALMSAVQFELPEARVLDLFAGTGQLGIEALSRGAKSCDFIDNDITCTDMIKRNLKKAGLEDSGKVIRSDVEIWLKGNSKTEKYDIVFLDPPYGQETIPALLEHIAKICTTTGKIICESEKKSVLEDEIAGFIKSKDYLYGIRKINIYRKNME